MTAKPAEKLIEVSQGHLRYLFAPNGTLRNIILSYDDNDISLLDGKGAHLKIAMGDGRQLQLANADQTPPVIGRFEEAKIVEFNKLHAVDQNGQIDRNVCFSLHYELWPDGTGFVNFFYMDTQRQPLPLQDFNWSVKINRKPFNTIRWGTLHRPAQNDGTVIQFPACDRYLEEGCDHEYPGEIIPLFNFNCTDRKNRQVYLEFLMEGQNSLSGQPHDNRTALTWNGRQSMKLLYSFIQESPCLNRNHHLWQWRNQFGWVIKAADAVRHKPPCKMYHFFDNATRYPNTQELKNIAATGADMLVMHENWRLDPQNGGIPFDEKKFAALVRKAHAHNIRVLTYIRGNEESVVEGACEWFDRHLRKNQDGLYMDYGGPFHKVSADENYTGGRVHFRRHYLDLKKLRERIGPEGVFLSHTGPFFSAIGIGFMDGYVSGEGEGGIMVKSRELHAYYSMAATAPGTMWTAAFPTYSTQEMIPFLASTGQYPHSTLGVQHPSCSLAHPRDPGINDRVFRPLWKCWELFSHERNIAIYNDYNGAGVFKSTADTGHYLMLSRDRRRALLLVSNFSREPVAGKLQVRLPFLEGLPVWKLSPAADAPGQSEKLADFSGKLDFALPGLGLVAFYFSASLINATRLLQAYATPYPPLNSGNKKYLKYVEEQRRLHDRPEPARELFCQVVISCTPQATAYEYSLVYDLFLNTMELGTLDSNGAFNSLGYLSKDGLQSDEPKPEDYIWPHQPGPWLPLHKIFPPGEHRLAIRTLHYKQPFYSFIWVRLASQPDGKDLRTLDFVNELELDRSMLKFTINLKK